MIIIDNKVKAFLRLPYNILFIIFTYTFFFGIFCDNTNSISTGLLRIVSDRSILITDYIAVGGIGATFINVSLTSLLILTMYQLLQLKPNGSLLVAFWMCAGFSFFGKNILNTWPIIFGAMLFAKYKKEGFMRYSLPAVLSTTLAPVVSEVYNMHFFTSTLANMAIATIVGITVGFLIIPIASNAVKAHSGFNLYNVGFAAGILGLLIMGIIRGMGVALPTRPDIWDTNNSVILSVYVITICIFLIVVGFYLTDGIKFKMGRIFKSSGRLVTDFYTPYREAAYINMGINGLFALIIVHLIRADINGPTIGAIFTIIGFGAFGKHIKNMTPVVIGAILATLISTKSFNDPAIVIAILFSTGLAPIAGTFGIFEGILAGMLHIFVVSNVGVVHGGLNLYNNGFAAGFVAMILVPLIASFKKEESI